VLRPSQSTPIEVLFAPTESGPRSATLRIESDDPDESPLEVALSGTGILPDIAIDAASHDYGTIPGGERASWIFEVGNEGTADLHVSSVKIGGSDANDFELVTDPGPFTLNPSQSVPIEVVFAPSQEGFRSATLRIESDDPDENPLAVPVSGTGTLPDIAIDAVSHDYGAVRGGESAARTFQVSNEDRRSPYRSRSRSSPRG
jgi:hypothetical protein